MSRIGRKPIPVPSGVKINTTSGNVEVQGPKGKLRVLVPTQIRLEQKDGVLNVLREGLANVVRHAAASRPEMNGAPGASGRGAQSARLTMNCSSESCERMPGQPSPSG